MKGAVVDCAKCGRIIPIDESSEWELVKRGAMVEFYYCRDREACDRARNRQIDENR